MFRKYAEVRKQCEAMVFLLKYSGRPEKALY
jgi:hypothetical protein